MKAEEQHRELVLAALATNCPDKVREWRIRDVDRATAQLEESEYKRAFEELRADPDFGDIEQLPSIRGQFNRLWVRAF